MPHLEEGTIHAWLDGALSDDEARAVESHIESCAECSAAVAEARGLVAAASRILRSLDDDRTVPVSRERVAVPPVPQRRRFSATWLRAAAVLVVAAGTVTVARRVSFDRAASEAPAPIVAATPGRAPAPSGAAGSVPAAPSEPTRSPDGAVAPPVVGREPRAMKAAPARAAARASEGAANTRFGATTKPGVGGVRQKAELRRALAQRDAADRSMTAADAASRPKTEGADSASARGQQLAAAVQPAAPTPALLQRRAESAKISIRGIASSAGAAERAIGPQADTTGTIKGLVLLSGGAPAVNATVMVRGASLATTSDSTGSFALGGVPAGERLVMVRRIGFTPASAPVLVAPRETTAVSVTLAPSVLSLERVVVADARTLGAQEGVRPGLSRFAGCYAARHAPDGARTLPALLPERLALDTLMVGRVNGVVRYRVRGLGGRPAPDGAFWSLLGPSSAQLTWPEEGGSSVVLVLSPSGAGLQANVTRLGETSAARGVTVTFDAVKCP